MSDLLEILPYIVGAQALGVGLAWGVDALSWNWRDRDPAAGFINIFGLLLALFLISSLPNIAAAMVRVASVIGLITAWLLVVTSVQKRQLKAPFRATFFGALMQLICFVWALFLYFIIIILPARLAPGWSVLLWFVTAVFTYALLSLFRPTIHGTWNLWRQNGKK